MQGQLLLQGFLELYFLGTDALQNLSFRKQILVQYPLILQYSLLLEYVLLRFREVHHEDVMVELINQVLMVVLQVGKHI